MPKVDPDPYSPSWSSSSSETNPLQPSPLIPNSLCWWTLRTSSKPKHSSCLTKARFDAFNLKSYFVSSPAVAVTLSQSHSLGDIKEKALKKEREFNWADKYRPKALKDFICHREKAEMLSHMVKCEGELGHYIFVGPPGVGKRTMVMAFLREYYGLDKIEGGTYYRAPACVRYSANLMEVNAFELKEYAPDVLMQLMKKQHFCHTDKRAIVVYEADKLSMKAQFSIRSLIEIFGSQSKVIFCCSCIKEFSLRSICTVVHLLPPSSLEIVEVLNFIANQAAIELPSQLAQRIAENSNNSLRQAIRSFEATLTVEGVPISSIQVNLRVSSQHIEVNVPQLKEYAVEILLQLIEQINCKLSNQKHLQLQLHHTNHKAIVLHEAEQLSKDAQQYIRSLIQTNDHIMVIFCCSEVWKPQNIIYHCKVIQLHQPSNKEIVEVLEFIAKQEAIELPCQLVEDIAHKSKNNLRQAIRSFEATCRLNYPFKGSQVIQTGWEDELAKIAKAIVQEELSLQQTIDIRDTLAALKEHHLSPLFIFNTLVVELKKNIDDGFQSHFASFLQDYNNSNVKTESLSDENYEHAYDNAQLDMRIQEFIANFISFYKTLLKDKKKTGGVKLSSQGIPLMLV